MKNYSNSQRRMPPRKIVLSQTVRYSVVPKVPCHVISTPIIPVKFLQKGGERCGKLWKTSLRSTISLSWKNPSMSYYFSLQYLVCRGLCLFKASDSLTGRNTLVIEKLKAPPQNHQKNIHLNIFVFFQKC